MRGVSLVAGTYVSRGKYSLSGAWLQKSAGSYRILAHKAALTHWLGFEDITVMHDDSLDWLLWLSCGLLLLVRQDLCMEFC